MKEKLVPLLQDAPIFEKYKEIFAKEAQGGEVIITITNDGVETQNTAQEGDFIVQNITDAKEQYIMPKDKFTARYTHLEEAEDGFNRYKPIGKIKAILVTKEVINLLEAQEEFYFIAPWGAQMVAKEGDYLVSPLDYSEVYRIAQKEFFETYQEEK